MSIQSVCKKSHKVVDNCTSPLPSRAKPPIPVSYTHLDVYKRQGLERTKEDFGKNYNDQFESVAEHPYNCIIFLRSKHRPDCYYAKGDEQILISPAIAEMNGIFPIVREEDMEKLTPEKVYDIYREVSISKEKLQEIIERIKAAL